jgi:hypothetical protein
VIGLLVGLALGQVAFADDTAQEKFLKAVESKVAPLEGTFVVTGKFKELCYCKGTGMVGVIESNPTLFGAILIFCSTPVFNPDGTSKSTEICESDFVPLTKP